MPVPKMDDEMFHIIAINSVWGFPDYAMIASNGSGKVFLNGWHVQFTGKDGKLTVILEAGCEYFTCFWHANFGRPGSFN